MPTQDPPPARPRVMVVDDDASVHGLLSRVLAKTYDLLAAQSGEAGLAVLRNEHVDLVLLDIRMPTLDGFEVLRRLRDAGDATPVVVMTVMQELRTAIEVMRLGAVDYVVKPVDLEVLGPVIARALEHQAVLRGHRALREVVRDDHAFDRLVGASAAIAEIRGLIERVAGSPTTVLLTGESGTGKEIVARTIHEAGPRSTQPFIPVNCAAIPGELLESELFGHEKGAFTGAVAGRPGKFELAEGGALFLDEIGHLRLDLQPKLLRALQDHVIERLGGHRPQQIDVRVIAATNRDLQRAVAAGTFREDLFYRINVVHIPLPPLRHRLEDLHALVEHFLAKHARAAAHRIQGLSDEAWRALQEYEWPGNVRELENVIERAMTLSREDVITLKDLPMEISLLGRGPADPTRADALTFREARRRFEAEYVLRALARAGGNQSEAARRLGLPRNTFLAILRRLGVIRQDD